MLHTILAIGRYEDRIVAYTHGNVDVTPAWQAYGLLEDLTPPGTADTVADRFWMFASLAAAAAFAGWLYQARRNGGWRGWWWASVFVMVALQGLLWLYDVVTTRGGAMRGSWLDTRLVAYPLWTAATVTVVVTAIVCVRVIRRSRAHTSTCRDRQVADATVRVRFNHRFFDRGTN